MQILNWIFLFFDVCLKSSLKNDLFTLIWFDTLLWTFALFLPDFSARLIEDRDLFLWSCLIYNLVKRRHWTIKTHYNDSIKFLTSNLNPIQSSKLTVYSGIRYIEVKVDLYLLFMFSYPKISYAVLEIKIICSHTFTVFIYLTHT